MRGSNQETRLELFKAFQGLDWVPLEVLKQRTGWTTRNFFTVLYSARAVKQVEGRETGFQRASYRLTAAGVAAMGNVGAVAAPVAPDKAEPPRDRGRGQNARFWQKIENWSAILKEMKEGEWYPVPQIVIATRSFYAESSARSAVSAMERDCLLESRRADLHGGIKQVRRLISEHEFRMMAEV